MLMNGFELMNGADDDDVRDGGDDGEDDRMERLGRSQARGSPRATRDVRVFDPAGSRGGAFGSLLGPNF